MRSLHIVSGETGSIGEITKDLLEGLQNSFDVTFDKDSKPLFPDILLCHFINPIVVNNENFKTFKKKILIQPIDGTEIKRGVIKEFNQFDLIITPGKAGITILRNNGVTVPIKVIPNYYKEDILTSILDTKIKQIPKNKIIFYHESTCHPRKGVEIFYEGFIRAFSDTEYADKVLLVVKDMPFNHITFDRIEKLKRDMIKLQKSYENPARIIKISQFCDWETLRKLWANCNIYVSPSKIEGFGIPMLRMAVLKKPIITLENYNSGYMDFLNKDTSYLIPTKQEIAPDEFMWLYESTTQWGIPINIEQTVKVFKEALKDYLAGSPKLVPNSILDEMKFENVLKKYVDVIKNV